MSSMNMARWVLIGLNAAVVVYSDNLAVEVFAVLAIAAFAFANGVSLTKQVWEESGDAE